MHHSKLLGRQTSLKTTPSKCNETELFGVNLGPCSHVAPFPAKLPTSLRTTEGIGSTLSSGAMPDLEMHHASLSWSYTPCDFRIIEAIWSDTRE